MCPVDHGARVWLGPLLSCDLHEATQLESDALAGGKETLTLGLREAAISMGRRWTPRSHRMDVNLHEPSPILVVFARILLYVGLRLFFTPLARELTAALPDERGKHRA